MSGILEQRCVEVSRKIVKVFSVTSSGPISAALQKRRKREICWSQSAFHAGLNDVRRRPGATSVVTLRAARSSDRMLLHRPGDKPSARGATSASRARSSRGSAGICSGARPRARAVDRAADLSSCRRRSGKSISARLSSTSARVSECVAAREETTCDTICVVMT